MAWGDASEQVLAAHRAAGGRDEDLPFIRGRVDVPDHLGFTWEAFWVLCTERPISFGGVGRIPFRAILEYACAYGVRGVDALERFRLLVMAMDRAFIEEVARK